MVRPEEKSEWSSTGEYIPENARHWRVEPFIPIPTADLAEYLLARMPPTISRTQFLEVCRGISNRMHQRWFPMMRRIDEAYARLDPDRDTSLLIDRPEEVLARDSAEVAQWMRQALEAADYTPLTREQLEAAAEVASLWSVPLHVDLDIFRHLEVYARGDIMGMREYRRWTRLYRKELVEVPIYRRVVVLFQVLPETRIGDEGQSDRLYLRMFKNIPQADIDMALPGTRVRIGWYDRTRILVPSIGGLGMSLWKLARVVLLVAVITTGKLVVLAGLVGAALGYVFRTVTTYVQTKKNYELNLTRSLYFQKLDCNAGVIYRVFEEARQQDYREAVLAYWALLGADQPVHRRRVRRQVERLLREALGTEVAFEVDDALRSLRGLELAWPVGTDHWAAADLDVALERLSRMSANEVAVTEGAAGGSVADHRAPAEDQPPCNRSSALAARSAASSRSSL